MLPDSLVLLLPLDMLEDREIMRLVRLLLKNQDIPTKEPDQS